MNRHTPHSPATPARPHRSPNGRRAGVVAVLGAAIATLVPYGPAVADVEDTYDVPAAAALSYPPAVGTTVVIDGPAHVWKMRAFAKRIDGHLPGVAFVSGRAADHPGAFLVTVTKPHLPAENYAGYTTMRWDDPDGLHPTGATITLNTSRDYDRKTKRQVAAHELMHVLGFEHHADVGLVGATARLSLEPMPGADEWVALHAYYG